MSIEAILKLARPEVLALQSYDNLRGQTATDAVIMDSNENIASPTKELTESERFRYPQIQPQQLVDRLAEIYQLPSEQIMLGRGSDDVIDSLLRVFCRAGKDAILQVSPCFSMYAIAAQIQGARVISVPLHKEQNFAYDMDEFIQAFGQNRTNNVKLIFLASPQSHIGNSLSRTDLLKLLSVTRERCVVVIDEAYIELSPENSATDLLSDHPHLIIMRTLSKAYGLANVRCGAMLAHPELVKLVRKVVTPYALPGIVVDTVYAALQDDALKNIQKINAGMQKRKQALRGLLSIQNWCIKQYAGDANYILCEVKNSQLLNHYLEQNNIFVRNFSPDSVLGECLRFSVGSDTDLQKLESAFNNYSF